jgi:hypothetical protein
MKTVKRGKPFSKGRKVALAIWLSDPDITIKEAAAQAGICAKTAGRAIREWMAQQKAQEAQNANSNNS